MTGKTFSWVISVVAICLVVFGCSSGGSQPLIPNETPDTSYTGLNIPIGVTDWSEDGYPVEGMGVLGAYNCSVTPERLAADISPIRKINSTDVLEVVDVSNFLQLNPCTDCVKVKSVALDSNGFLVLEIGIKHPYPAGNPDAPISGRNRADLHVFNVEGIILSNSPTYYFPQLDERVAFPLLRNADGYTKYLDEVMDEIYPTEATIHPYKTFFTDFTNGNYNPDSETGFESVTDPPPSGHLVMPMGSGYSYKKYQFDIDEPFEFLFAVGCSYGISTENRYQRFNPVYRLPQYNKKAASMVYVEVTRNELIEGYDGYDAEFQIYAVDLNFNATVGDGLDQMRCESYIQEAQIEVPDVTDHLLNYSRNAFWGDGTSPDHPIVSSSGHNIFNTNFASAGYHLGLARLLDSYVPGQNERENIQGDDGIKRVDPSESPLTGTFPIDELVTFQVFEVYVKPYEECGPVTGRIIEPQGPIGPIRANQTVDFYLESSTSPFGGQTGYIIDVDYDGIEFDGDYNISADDGDIYTFRPYNFFPNSCEEDIPYTFHLAFMAFDQCRPSNNVLIGTCDVLVDECLPMVNIPLRDDAVPVDITSCNTLPDEDLFILYDDGQIWRYYAEMRWQQTEAEYVFTAKVNVYNKPGKLCNNRIQTSAREGIEPRMIVTNADGISPDGYTYGWPSQAFDYNGSFIGIAPMPETGGPVPDVLVFDRLFPVPHAMGFLAHDNNLNEDSIYMSKCGDDDCLWAKLEPVPGLVGQTGYDKLYNPQVRSVMTGAGYLDHTEFWVLEDAPDYYCARFGINVDELTYYYADMYFGLGYQTDGDSGWNNSKDIARIHGGTYLVLDELSDGTGVIKTFRYTNQNFEPRDHVDIPDEFSSKPIKMAQVGNDIFVIHGDDINGYYMSWLDESEFPWD